MDWLIIVIIAIVVTTLVTWLIMRNKEDRKNVEHQLNQDYHKTKDTEGDVDAEAPMK